MGWRQWVTGARPTAAQFQADLQDQTINRCTSSTRPAAANCTDGLHIFETDTSRYYRWVGPAVSGTWVRTFGASRSILTTIAIGSNPVLATINAGLTDIPNVTQTFTVPDAGDYTVFITLNFTATKAGSGFQSGGFFSINVDGSGVGQYHDFPVEAGGNRIHWTVTWRGSLTAGSHTVKLQGQTNTLTAFTTSGYTAVFEVVRNS